MLWSERGNPAIQNPETSKVLQAFRALDFRVPGVPLRQLFKICKSQPRSGCGIYHKSGFVHMDSREKSTTWVGR